MRLPILLTAAMALGACRDPGPTAPTARELHAPPAAGTAAGRTVVMTRNMYVGADVDAVIAALASPDPTDELPALLAALETLARTDFPVRAAAMADEIAGAAPHAIALQEVSRIVVDLTPLGLPVQYDADFLPALLAALQARGLSYAVAGSVENLVVAPLPGVELRDRDVVLVDEMRVEVLAARGGPFAANIGVVAPGVDLRRGYVKVDAKIGGQALTIVGTHLESGRGPMLEALRAAQAQELAALLSASPRAVVLGDLNDGPASPMHQVLAEAGFADVWDALRPGTAGMTCCHLPDLSNQRSAFDQRIDYVFARGFGEAEPRLAGRIELVGAHPGDRRVGSGGTIWPSDHAGLVAALLEPDGRR